MLHRTLVIVTLLVGIVGCTSTKTSNTARTGTEQLLISNAVDQSLAKVDFRPMTGKKVHVEDKYLDAIDKGYITSSVRHHVLYSGAELAAKPEEADVILELRSGGVGTDISDSYLGVPGIQIPGAIALPDLKLVTRSRQSAYAKIGLVAVDAKTHRVLGEGGVSLAMSDDNNWFVMGVGPYQDGSIKREVSSSIGSIGGSVPAILPTSVSFRRGKTNRVDESEKIELTGSEEDPNTGGKVRTSEF